MSPAQIDESFFGVCRRHKRHWRRHENKAARLVRRFVKNNHRSPSFKAEGRGEGANRFAFLSDLTKAQVDETSYDEASYGD